MPAWEKPESLLKSKIQPTRSQRYNPSAVIWVQNTMAVREKSLNHYDGTPGQSTIRKKFVTPSRGLVREPVANIVGVSCPSAHIRHVRKRKRVLVLTSISRKVVSVRKRCESL